MNAGHVQMLVIVGESNPVFSAPADLKFAEAMRKVSARVHSGLFFDETATLSHWHVPAAHYLEAWSDARTIDGTVSIVQPLIEPLYGGKSAHDDRDAVGSAGARRLRLVREYWQGAGRTAASRDRGCATLSRSSGASGCTTASSSARVTAASRAAHAALATLRRCGVAPRAGAGAVRRHRGQLPARPDHLRRPLRQQRLAAGTAEADVEAHVGQRRAHFAGDGRGAATSATAT